MSSVTHPLSAAAINQYMSELTEIPYSKSRAKTIRRNLMEYCDTMTYFELSPGVFRLDQVVTAVTGGRIIHVTPEDIAELDAEDVEDTTDETADEMANEDSKLRHYFYFEPIMSDSDLNLINGSISSSRYLSESEMQYLLSRLSVLNAYVGDQQLGQNPMIPPVNLLPAPKASRESGTLPVKSSVQLSNIQILHHAITNHQQVQIVYGYYDADSKHARKLTFLARNAEKPGDAHLHDWCRCASPGRLCYS